MELLNEILEDKVHPCVLRRGDLVRAVATVVLEAVTWDFRREPVRLDDAVTEMCTNCQNPKKRGSALRSEKKGSGSA